MTCSPLILAIGLAFWLVRNVNCKAILSGESAYSIRMFGPSEAVYTAIFSVEEETE